MTPKEKATELVEKYAPYCWGEEVCDYDLAKECALIAVDELINEIRTIDPLEAEPFVVNWEKYWNEVKTEIENV